MTSAPATRSDWKTVPTSAGFTTFHYADHFSSGEFEQLQRGVVPRDMDEKWFIFYEPPTLFLHRSWTGELVYRVTFEPNANGADVVQAEVSERYAADPMHGKLLPWVIRCVLLRQDVPFPDI